MLLRYCSFLFLDFRTNFYYERSSDAVLVFTEDQQVHMQVFRSISVTPVRPGSCTRTTGARTWRWRPSRSSGSQSGRTSRSTPGGRARIQVYAHLVPPGYFYSFHVFLTVLVTLIVTLILLPHCHSCRPGR